MDGLERKNSRERSQTCVATILIIIIIILKNTFTKA